MPDAQNADGVAIYRHQTFPDQVDWHEQVIESWDEEPRTYLAFPILVAEALVAVAEAARIAVGPNRPGAMPMRRLEEALDRLDAARGAK